jgi:ATP-binding cassette subfamily C protein CydC
MNTFLQKHIFQPLAGRWLLGISVLIFWTVAFVALPAISGWFLAASTVAFITANALFAYLIPSSLILFPQKDRLSDRRCSKRYYARTRTVKLLNLRADKQDA